MTKEEIMAQESWTEEDYEEYLQSLDELYSYDDNDEDGVDPFDDADGPYDGQPDEAQEWKDFDPDC
jgi:hypothetical protein